MESLELNKELTKFEKFLEGKNILEVGQQLLKNSDYIVGLLKQLRSYSLDKYMDDDFLYDNNLEGLKIYTERFVIAHNRFDQLKAFGGDKLLKAASDRAKEIEDKTIYRLGENNEIIVNPPREEDLENKIP